ncbi:putative endoglucanase [Planctomycetes bacterium CA13]|uniref:Putative endoglucanase n=1 Tax=Novipirellula herctigrandis TaxID=2527986 RepID=A0A5C5YYX2_9BACT|nr:putative endoglucanase [Planctomycetes bacterium CA13]
MKRLFAFITILLTASAILLPCIAADQVNHNAEVETVARQWDTIDICFQAKSLSAQPVDAEFSALLQDDTGKQIEVPGFYNGDHDYLIRFTPSKTGRWSYVTRSTQPDLNGKKGVFIVESARAGRRGAVVIDPASPREFRYENGDSYYPIAFELDWLFALDSENAGDIPKTRMLVDTVADGGFNQVVMNVFADDVDWPKDEALPTEYEYGSPKVFPFAGTNSDPDHSQLNIEYFKRLDRVIEYLDEREIAAHLMIYVWNKNVSWPKANSDEDNRYFDYVVRRYQAYPNLIWDISKEALGYGHNDVNYISQRIERLRKLDSHHRLVSVHDWGYCKRFPEKVDFMSVQIWSSELYSRMQKIRAESPTMPVLNIEHGGYEEGPYAVFTGCYISPEVCLERAYQCVFAGTYPTHYWQDAAWNVIIPNIQELDPANRPRLDYYRHLRSLVERYDMGRLRAEQKHSNSGFCMHNNDDLFIYYVPKENVSIGIKLPKKNNGRKMIGTWFDPFTGTFSEPIVETNSGWPGFDKPDGDRFAILIVQVQPNPEDSAFDEKQNR